MNYLRRIRCIDLTEMTEISYELLKRGVTYEVNRKDNEWIIDILGY